MFHEFPRYHSVRFVIVALAVVCLASWATFLTYSHSARGTSLVLPLTSPMVVSPPAMTFTVNSLADTNDGACDMTDCTLREAINAANSNPGLDTISFNIPGGGVRTIQPFVLPAITDPVIIDGYSQPVSSVNTLASGNNANILIEIKKPAGPALSFGLQIDSGGGGSTIRGLVIDGFTSAQIYVNGSNGNNIAGNYIGTNPSGTASASNRGAGVRIFGGAGNIIGGTTPADGNLISGNGVETGIFNGNPFFSVNGSPGIFLDGGFDLITRNSCNTATPITGTIIQGNLMAPITPAPRPSAIPPAYIWHVRPARTSLAERLPPSEMSYLVTKYSLFLGYLARVC